MDRTTIIAEESKKAKRFPGPGKYLSTKSVWNSTKEKFSL